MNQEINRSEATGVETVSLEMSEIASNVRTHVLSPIKRSLVGKDEIVEILGIALIAGENLFLLGPPGTAKSALVHALSARLAGQSFDYLLTRFTEPSELFGPFDLRKLRDGELVTNTDGMLPEADFVFLDELMNANSAILNSLLLALNERVFRRGREREKLPMMLAVGASNHLPSDDSLAALFDRFLLRVVCDNVSDEALGNVLDCGWKLESAEPIEALVSVDDIRRLQQAVLQIDVTTVREPLIELVRRLRALGIPVSDRRAVRLQRVIAASAIICARRSARISDLWPLRYIWETPAQKEVLIAQIDAIQHEYQDEEPGEGAFDHPMADQAQMPSPDRLNEQLAALLDAEPTEAAQDELTLLAARVEWVDNETSREHLRNEISELRKRWTETQE